MSLIAEFELSNPILRETRRAVPDVDVVVEDEQFGNDDPPRLVVWTVGEASDLERFEAGIPDDPSIEAFERLAELEGRRLYRITLSEEGDVGMTYPNAVDLGITFLDIRGAGDGVRYRAQVPSREALFAYFEVCRDRGLSFQLQGLYRGERAERGETGLTPRQHEALTAALERGYFDVPRQVTLEELADELDVSDQALSALVRRGLASHLRHTLEAEENT